MPMQSLEIGIAIDLADQGTGVATVRITDAPVRHRNHSREFDFGELEQKIIGSEAINHLVADGETRQVARRIKTDGRILFDEVFPADTPIRGCIDRSFRQAKDEDKSLRFKL